MNKNTSPYSMPSGVQLAYADDFSVFVIIKGQFYGSFKGNKGWHPVPEVPGTLSPGNESDGAKNPIYTVNIQFRVSFSEIGNRNELEKFIGRGLVCRYVSAGGQHKLVGSKQHPLSLSLSEPPGFDGYEITLKGSDTQPESFIM